MKDIFKKIIFIAFICFVFVPVFALAHQPRLNKQRTTIVTDPEISKAYYGQLAGEPHFYFIKSDKPFKLYVNILVPDIEGQKTDVSFAIIKNKETESPLIVADGVVSEWKSFWEPFGRNAYLMGSEYEESVEAGDYDIVVWSSNNDSKYSLAVGKIESFNLIESARALSAIPKIKQRFFDESPMNFILSPFGLGYVLVMYLVVFGIGFAYKFLTRKFVKKFHHGRKKNIGRNDRLARVVIGGALLIFAIITTWNPLVLLLSGFCIFEAVFSWCAIYQVMGKNTCPI